MRLFQQINVYDAALERVRYIFDEFPNIVIGFSGGKDSTVTMQIALQVAEEKNRLPLKVMWVDQEAEWTATYEYVKEVFQDPRIEPIWLQVPLKIHNSGSYDEEWVTSWDPENEENWIRPKEPNSIHENTWDCPRWKHIFQRYLAVEYEGKKACYLAGVRAEESPGRYMGLTEAVCYKHITYGTILENKEHVTFYPLYDWSYTDIWKAIHDNKWPYCAMYDTMFQYGIKIPNMRVSNLHHETATRSLEYAQEVDRKAWNALAKRVHGANAFKHMKDAAWKLPKELPQAFDSWKEYAIYLFDNLIPENDLKEPFGRTIRKLMYSYRELPTNDLYRMIAATVIANDIHGTKLNNWTSSPNVNAWRQWKWDGIPATHVNPYINEEHKRGNI